jgi:iron complex outermembrane receptor protein
LDIDLEAAVSSQLTIRAGFEYLHARYKKFLGAPFAFPNPDAPFGNVQVDCTANPAGCDASGNRLPRSAEFSGSIAADYRVPVGSGELAFNATYAYNDGWKWEADNRTSQKPFHIVNTQIMWTADEDRYSVRIWARNLLKEKYYTQVQSALSDLGVAAAPRTYGVTLGGKF